MSRPSPAEATLADIERDGDVLVLADGRRLEVSPAEASVASIWLPGARLTLRETRARGRRAAFDLAVTHEEMGQTVAARVR
jgi:hypothetical protein